MALHTPLVAPTLQPTYVGLIITERDALLIVEACLSGLLGHIPRFPLHNEQEELVCGGNVYVYADVPTGEGVWDDGKEWIKCESLGTMIVQRNGSGGDGFFRLLGSYTVQGMAHVFVSYHQAKDFRWDPYDIGHSRSAARISPSQDVRFPITELRPDLHRLLCQPRTTRSMTGQEGRSHNNGAE